MQRFYSKNTFNVCDNMEYFLSWAVCLATYLVCVGVGLCSYISLTTYLVYVGIGLCSYISLYICFGSIPLLLGVMIVVTAISIECVPYYDV